MRLTPLLGMLTAACSHTEPFTTVPTGSDTPFAPAAPTRLTFNTSTDSAASLTADGHGILYLYSAEDGSGDRCIGLLGQTGGTRRWQLCDSRIERVDSAKSFSAPALDAAGRLLYLQALSPRGLGNVSRARLWLADTATPFVRRELLSFPTNIAGRGISWLTDAQWTSPTTFLARGGLISTFQNCPGLFCPWDTTVVATGVIRGTISAAATALAVVPGAETALFYAIVEEATTLVVVRSQSLIVRLAVGGGAGEPLPALSTAGTITGIGCHRATCVVTQSAPRPAPASGHETRFHRIDLATSTTTLLRTELGRWAGPVVLRPGRDVVAQSSTGPTRDLYLFKDLLP